MNVQLQLGCDSSILAELRTKFLFLKNIRELQFDYPNSFAKRKMVESGQVAGYSIGADNKLCVKAEQQVPFGLLQSIMILEWK
ncbi:integrase [Gossypium australe]|uniref:Integrase n=1 Tax=Gossypium australe TaxID=47621 RepID=A0A5B6VP73_9ROSI|nr:integrase [Gossypium australe]